VKKKILHICYSGIGGQPNVTIALANFGTNVDKDFEHIVLFCGVEPLHEVNKKKCDQYEIEYYSILKNSKFDFKFYYQFYKRIICINPFIILAHTTTYHFIFLIARWFYKINIITVEHHSINLRSKTKWLHSQLSAWCSNIIVVLTNGALSIFKNKLYFVANKLYLIPNGFEYAHLKIIPKTASNVINLGIACRLTEGKDLKTVLKAFEKLCLQSNKQIRLLIAGDGDTKTALEIYSKSLSSSDKVTFLGSLNQEEMGAFYNNLNVLIISSAGEGFGLTVLEGFAYQVPIVATNVVGINEIIEDNKNGLLFEYGNVTQLVQQLNLLLNNEKYASQLSEKGFNDLNKEYSLQSTYAKYKLLFNHFS
jgi:L-malate glycosyltransferase